MTRAVSLFGTILESDGRILIDINPKLGDAERYGLAGQHSFLERQVCSFQYVAAGRDVVVVPDHIAASKGKRRPDPPPPPPRSSRGRK